MRIGLYLVLGTSLAALASAASAQTAPTAQSTPAKDGTLAAEEVDRLNEIVVTGTTSRNRTALESSVAITTADRADIDRRAPRSIAEALELVPGVYAEASGGEQGNNYSTRGLFGATNFIQLAEDGIPVFYLNNRSDAVLRTELSIERIEAVRGGTSGILTANGAAALINFITRKASEDTIEGSVRLTTSTYNTKRIDAFVGGPISDNWLFTLGGYYRRSDGLRDPGFTSEFGGLFRGSLTRKLDDGHLTLNFKMVRDHNAFYLPAPLQNASNPTSIPGFDALRGVLLSKDTAIQTVRVSSFYGNPTKVVDATRGVFTKSYSYGYDFDKGLTDEVRVTAKGRYTDFTSDFNAVFNFDNASLVPATVRLAPGSPGINALLARFPGTTPRFRNVATGQLIADPSSMNGNGLTVDSLIAPLFRQVKQLVTDTNISWQTDKNTLTGGLLFFGGTADDSNSGTSQFITDVRTRPVRLDIVAVDAQSNVIGSLTENGIYNYGGFGDGSSHNRLRSYNFYLNDELQIGERLRIDAGIRLEVLRYRQRDTNAGLIPVPGATNPNGTDVDNIIANNFIGQFGGGGFNGTFTNYKQSYTKAAYTVGGNYRVTDRIAIYGRYATATQNNGRFAPTDLNFVEAGVRYQSSLVSASVTGFVSTFQDFSFTRQLPGDSVATEFRSDIDTKGLEFDLLFRPVKFFQIQAIGAVQKAKIQLRGAQSSAPFDGNRPERTPNVTFTVTPSIFLPGGKGEVYATWQHIGGRFADIGNSVVLPKYDVFNAGARFAVTPHLDLSVSVQNLTNEVGLTEGNPRSGFTENVGSQYFFARPIFKRNAQFSATLSF